MAALAGMIGGGMNPISAVSGMFGGSHHKSRHSSHHQSIMPVNPFDNFTHTYQQFNPAEQQRRAMEQMFHTGVGGVNSVIDHTGNAVGHAGGDITSGLGKSLDGLMNSPGVLILGAGAIFLLMNKN